MPHTRRKDIRRKPDDRTINALEGVANAYRVALERFGPEAPEESSALEAATQELNRLKAPPR
jgi:hypothetical protein